MSELEITDQRSVGDVVDTPLSDLFSTQEIDLQFAKIAKFEETAKISQEPFVTFISPGFVSVIDTQLRDRFNPHLPHQASKHPLDLDPDLSKGFKDLIKNTDKQSHTRLFVRLGGEAVRPSRIDFTNKTAEPAPALLEPGSVFELRTYLPNIASHHGSYHEHQPHDLVGSYIDFFPIHTIGKILNEGGRLELKRDYPDLGEPDS